MNKIQYLIKFVMLCYLIKVNNLKINHNQRSCPLCCLQEQSNVNCCKLIIFSSVAKQMNKFKLMANLSVGFDGHDDDFKIAGWVTKLDFNWINKNKICISLSIEENEIFNYDGNEYHR